MSGKEREFSLEELRNDMLPFTSPTQFRSDAVSRAEELSKAADLIDWPRAPDLKDFEATAGRIFAAGFFWVGGAC